MEKLPLSWIRQNRDNIEITNIPINFEKGNWLSLGKVPYKFDIIKYLSNYISTKKGSVLLRGLNASMSNILGRKGFEVLPLGKEAVLSFNKNHFAKSSIREIIRRGFRSGFVEEIPYSPEIEKRLMEFEKKTVHGSEPLLTNLYVTGLPKETRLFVFKNDDDNWLGAIVISINSKDKYQTEFLLRKKSAPPGIMEALIYGIFNTLKTDGKKYWSLGEVPFVLSADEHKRFSKADVLYRIGHLFRFAYNFEGLFFFKNKFAPIWEDVYIASYPKITLRQMFTVSLKSNLLKLIVFKLITSRFFV